MKRWIQVADIDEKNNYICLHFENKFVFGYVYKQLGGRE